MGYFRNAPSENQLANRGAQFLFVVCCWYWWWVCVFCLFHHWGRRPGNASSQRVREWERGKEGDRETETKRRREKETWGGERGEAEREIERELRPVEIHHDVRHTDTLQPQIHHCSCVWRHNWTQETSELEMRSGARAGRERRGKRGKINWLLQLAEIWPKAPVRAWSAA